MIIFSNPYKMTMSSGNKCIHLTDSGTWESFPEFAQQYTQQLGAKVLEKIEGPDVHIWVILYDNVEFNLVYDDFPNGVSIETRDKNSEIVINKLYNLVKLESQSNGL